MLLSETFDVASMSELRHRVAARVAEAGVTGAVAEDFVLAVHELVANAVRHGGGSGRLDLRRMADVLICEVIDHGAAGGLVPIRLSEATQPGGRGLWLAHHLTGSLMVTRRADGVTASVSVCTTPSADVSGPGEASTTAEPADDR